MAFGSMIGLSFKKEPPENVDQEKVREAYRLLRSNNPLLLPYQTQEVAEALAEYHVANSHTHIDIPEGWRENILMPSEDVNPNAANIDISSAFIGHDSKNMDIQANHPSLMALLSPHLFITGEGHYSLVPKTSRSTIPENQGGIATASSHETFASYVKKMLFHQDRRFARDPSFIFWCFDMIEKYNIHSASRHKVRTGNFQLTKQDVINQNVQYRSEKVSIVPHTIRSSFAYKRKHYLDLKTLGERFGEPQIFLTFSCDDLSEEFKNATGSEEPWTDPVAFAVHYNRKWHEFFSIYIMKKWSRKIGGIKEWSYVLEVQDRGSPHMHVILWTNKSAKELLDMNIVSTTVPPPDSELYFLVQRHQIHSL